MAEQVCDFSSESEAEQSSADDSAVEKVTGITIKPGFLTNNVALVVEEQRLYVNKELLKSASSVFEAWLKKEWQSDEDTPELPFPDKTLEEMTTFLTCLLPSFPDKVTDETVDTVLPLADEYQTESLLTECMAAIRDNVKTVYKTNTYIPPSRLVTYLYWINKYKLDAIKDDVVRLAAALKSEELQAVPGYDKAGLPLQLEVSNVRATLLASLFVSNLVAAEKQMGEGVPLHKNYFPEWKKTTSQIVKRTLINQRICFKSTHSNTSRVRKETEEEQPTAQFLACISVSYAFGFSELYSKCIDMLRTREININKFETQWLDHYGECCDKTVLKQHLLDMCTCRI
ncbi:uncharacterized protein [Argopecten irradians]|uniref:uncharacterized protein isoform X2 n=1 Tax=Argopecten irradians TaxID=31199 RepID=UPI00371DF48B